MMKNNRIKNNIKNFIVVLVATMMQGIIAGEHEDAGALAS